MWVYWAWPGSIFTLQYVSKGWRILGAWHGWSFQDGPLLCVVAGVDLGSSAGAVDECFNSHFGLSIWLRLHSVDSWVLRERKSWALMYQKISSSSFSWSRGSQDQSRFKGWRMNFTSQEWSDIFIEGREKFDNGHLWRPSYHQLPIWLLFNQIVMINYYNAFSISMKMIIIFFSLDTLIRWILWMFFLTSKYP